MKKQLLMGVAIGALAAINPVLAADLPVKAPIMAPIVPVYNWTGCYVGGNIGYSWGRARGDINDPDLGSEFGLPGLFSISHNLNGVIGGGQAGCQRQFDNSWVLGLEADFQGSAEKHSRNFSDPFTVNNGEGVGTISQSIEAKIQWFGTWRARAGYLITPTIMLYGTGGLAYGKVSVTDNIAATITAAPGALAFPPFFGASSISASTIKVGWTLGAGVEGALFNWNNWTWKAEYLYIDLGSVSGSGVDPFRFPVSANAKVTDNIVRVGLNYRIWP
jgi:outer membrane immunogenic protein